mmetsp:Transcript_693/g.1451  ORF Transcript_693/g.1451 Transcript_693/m.1451 type:complete len:83 (+) Transcript_693:979-1227(+)
MVILFPFRFLAFSERADTLLAKERRRHAHAIHETSGVPFFTNTTFGEIDEILSIIFLVSVDDLQYMVDDESSRRSKTMFYCC